MIDNEKEMYVPESVAGDAVVDERQACPDRSDMEPDVTNPVPEVGRPNEGDAMSEWGGSAWTETATELPPEGVVVEVMNGDQVTTLVRDGRLWFFPDRSMYVYYVPKVWRLP